MAQALLHPLLAFFDRGAASSVHTLDAQPCRAVKAADVTQTEVAWQQKEVTVYGKTVMQPRMLAYMADGPSLAYTYSRQTMIPDAWTPAVRLIKVS